MLNVGGAMFNLANTHYYTRAPTPVNILPPDSPATGFKINKLLKIFSFCVCLLFSLLSAYAVAADTDIQIPSMLNLDFTRDFHGTGSCDNISRQAWNSCNSRPSLFLTLNETRNNTEENAVMYNGSHTANDSYLTQAISPHPDWEGLKQDTRLFLFYQFFVIGALFVMPDDLSGWSEEAKDTWGLQTYRQNLSHITWDRDKSWINYILHPYWGGTYYVRARNRGYDQRASMWYSVLLSSLYEFGSEALFERASAQDLIVTPLGGYFFGEYMMKARAKVQASMAAKATPSFYDKTLMIATDPLGWINHKTSRLLGTASRFSLQPISTLILPKTAPANSFEFQALNTNIKEEPARIPMKLGLQFNLSW